MDKNYKKNAYIFKVLGDETRLKILAMLHKGETCACKILAEFRFTQPTLSYHMKQLVNSELVTMRKDGKWVYYQINFERTSATKEFLESLFQSKKETLL